MSKTLELLEKYPETTKLIKDWYMKKMIESFNNDDVPEEIKEFMMAQGIQDDKLTTIIDGSPRALFDFFDENKVFIQINVSNAGTVFSYNINEGDIISGGWNNRRETESAAITSAFELLDKNLKGV
jgi:hypothetical protein